MPLRNVPGKTLRFITAPIRHWRISLTILIALAIAYVITDQILLSQLAAQREAVLAAGGHLSLKEFGRDIPDSENAAVVYKYAASLIKPMPSAQGRDPVELYIESQTCAAGNGAASQTPGDFAWVDGVIAENARAFDALLEAVAKPYAQYTDFNASGDIMLNPAFAVPEYNHLHALARLAALRAVWENSRGNPAEAFRWVGITLAIGNSVSEEPWLTAGLMRAAVHGIGIDALRAVTCNQPLPHPLPEILTAQLARAAELQSLARFYEGERWLQNAAQHFDFRPLGTANQIAGLKMTTDLIQAVALPDETERVKLIQQFQADVPTIKAGSVPILRMHRILADIVRPALATSVNALDRAAAQARLAQIAIALKQYKQARGQYPAELAQVAPEFIAAVPLDSFTGQPLRYRRQDNGFVVYSVGHDSKDDAGKEVNGKTNDVVWAVTE